MSGPDTASCHFGVLFASWERKCKPVVSGGRWCRSREKSPCVLGGIFAVMNEVLELGTASIQLYCLNLRDSFLASNQNCVIANNSPKATPAKLLCSFQLVESIHIVFLNSSSSLVFLHESTTRSTYLHICFSSQKFVSLRFIFLYVSEREPRWCLGQEL